MPVRRTKSVGTTLTEDKCARLEALAGAQPLSAFVRAAWLEATAPAVAQVLRLAARAARE